jgi:hypothetical protein
MSVGLTQYARRFFTEGESARLAHQHPVLVWEVHSTPPERELLMMQTLPGGPDSRPRAGEPLVFDVKKAGKKANAFALGVTIGRTESNDVTVQHESVSRFHAWLQQDARTGAWTLVDAESKNGTWMGPMKLSPNRAETLASGAKLRFGEVELLFLPPEAFFAYIEQKSRG